MNLLLLTFMLLPLADPVSQDAELIKGWLKVSQKHAEDYVIHPSGDAKAAFTMLPQAVFRHSQPVRGDDIGAVYLWVDADKRPAVIGTTFAYRLQEDLRAVVHEFHSLADMPLEARWRDRSHWKSPVAGLKWRAVPNAPAVEKSAIGRQRQTREITRRFQAESIDHKQARWELRLLAKPIYQFDIERPTKVLGGSLSVFCQGTDPELILAVEAQKVNDTFVWHYAAANFTDFALKLRLDDKEVWSNKEYSASQNSPYWAETVSRERLSKTEDAKP